MTPLASAVNRFRRRIGPTAAFDLDDARQEARIKAWQTGDARQCAAYGAIFDAFKALHRGWVARRHLAFADDQPAEALHMDSPEEILIARQALQALRERATLHGVDVIGALADGEPQKSIAARAGVTPGRLSQVLTEARA